MTDAGLGHKVLVASHFPDQHVEDPEVFEPSHNADSTWGTASRTTRGF